MKKESQLSFIMRSHGGFREGAGRKKTLTDEPKHIAREWVDKRIPLHVNFKVAQQVPCLRTPQFMRALPKILTNAREKGLRVQQFVVESNHIHLLVEADGNSELSRGMMSLKASIAWALRKIFMFHGRVFQARYYVRALKTPTEVRNALQYVLFNHAKHTKVALFADVYSSVFGFGDADDFVDLHGKKWPPWFHAVAEVLSEPRTWMQAHGWRRAKR